MTAAGRLDIVGGVFWPLIGAFIAFVLFAVFMGWVMDPARHGDGDGPAPHA